jgi:hypothetical protein
MGGVSCPTPIEDVSPATASGRAELATYVEHAQGCASCAAHLERLRHLERELSHLLLDVDPSGSACPSPEGLLVWMAGESADPTEIDLHLVGCASCRGDVLVAVRAGAEEGERQASSRRLAASSSGSSRRKLETTKGSSSSSTRKLSSSSTRKLSSSSTRKLEAASAPGSSSSSSRKLAAKRPSSRRGRIQPVPEVAHDRRRVWPQRLAAAAILALVASVGFSALRSRSATTQPTRASAPPATTEQPTTPRPVTPRTTTERTTTERRAPANTNAWYDDWLSSIDELVAERAAAGTATDAPPPITPPSTQDDGAGDPADPDPDAGSWEPTEAPSPLAPPPTATEAETPSDPTQPDPAPGAERPLLEIASSRGVRVRLPDEGSWRRLDGTKVPAGAMLRASSRGGVVALGTSAIYLGPDARLTVEEDGKTLAVASGPMFVEGEENVVLGHALGRVRVNGQAFIASRRGALAMASFAGTLSFEPAEPGSVRGVPRTVTIYPGEQTLATLKEVGETRPMTGDDVARILPDWVTSLRPATLPPVTLPPDSGGAAGDGGELSGGGAQSGPGSRGNPGGGGAAGGARGAGVGGAAARSTRWARPRTRRASRSCPPCAARTWPPRGRSPARSRPTT